MHREIIAGLGRIKKIFSLGRQQFFEGVNQFSQQETVNFVSPISFFSTVEY
jgi:hypothetical protein